MTIADKLKTAASLCAYVQKDGANTHFKYRFVSAANILGHVNDALAAAGLAVVGTLPEVLSTEGTGKDRVVTVRMTVTVADTETSERATFAGLGSGMDTGDKAAMKAQTAALKYAWLGAFSISTGDDPEADDATDKRTAGGGAAQKKPTNGQAPAPPQRSAPPDRPDATTAPKGSTSGLAERHDALIQKIDAVGSQTDAAKLWHAERATVGQLNDDLRKELWGRLCVRTAKVGKMGDGDAGRKAADAWLRKALAEEAARAAQGNGGASTTAPAG
jgi:hypothetical protein